MEDIILYTENKGLEGIEFSMGEYKKTIGVKTHWVGFELESAS